MSVAKIAAKAAAPIIIDAVGDKLKDMSPDDIVFMLKTFLGDALTGGGVQPPSTMYNGNMYDDSNLPIPRRAGQLVPKGLADILNGTATSKAIGKSGGTVIDKDSAEDAVVVHNTGGGSPPNGTGSENKDTKVPYDKNRYNPPKLNQALNKFILPILGDTASVMGNVSNIKNSLLGQMLAATADARNTQSSYSNLIPKQYSTGGNIAAAMYTGKGMIGKTIGDTVNNRLQETAASNWAQDMQDANRQFYIDYEPNNGQQEYEARLLTSAKNKVERSAGKPGASGTITSDADVKCARSNALRRPNSTSASPSQRGRLRRPCVGDSAND